MVIPLAVISLRLAGAPSDGGAAPMPKAETGTTTPEDKFPYVIRITASPTSDGFLPGDAINVTEVRSDRKRLETGGTYQVTGTYTLASAPKAKLGLTARPDLQVADFRGRARRRPFSPHGHGVQCRTTPSLVFFS